SDGQTGAPTGPATPAIQVWNARIPAQPLQLGCEPGDFLKLPTMLTEIAQEGCRTTPTKNIACVHVFLGCPIQRLDGRISSLFIALEQPIHEQCDAYGRRIISGLSVFQRLRHVAAGDTVSTGKGKYKAQRKQAQGNGSRLINALPGT